MKKYLLLLLLFNCQHVIDKESRTTENRTPIFVRGEDNKNAVNKLEPTMYFAFDSSSLSVSARKKLQNNLLWMQSNTKANIIIEGHCDERGTREYNLALGERRAYAVKRFLVNGGINAARIRTVSFGAERPAIFGMGEGIYRLNRRAEIKVK